MRFDCGGQRSKDDPMRLAQKGRRSCRKVITEPGTKRLAEHSTKGTRSEVAGCIQHFEPLSSSVVRLHHRVGASGHFLSIFPKKTRTCDAHAYCGIMQTMPLRGCPTRKSVAWLLPLCFMSSFVACLCNCSHEQVAGIAIAAQESAEVFSSLDDCENCSILSSPILLPQRPSTNEAHASNRTWWAPVTLSTTLSLEAEFSTPEYMVFSSTSPPLERLCVIRI